MKNNSALFYTCSLIEFIGRERKLKRSELVQFFGKKVIERIYRYADVFHCEPIEKTADDFITNLNIPTGSFDNVSSCRYNVPDYWTIGEVYERLIEDIAGDHTDRLIDSLIEVFADSFRPAVWQRIKLRVKSIEVFAVQLLLSNAQHFTEALEVDDFPLPQEFNWVAHIRVIHQPQDVVVGHPCLLFCCNHIRTTFD